jgi:phage-related protein
MKQSDKKYINLINNNMSSYNQKDMKLLQEAYQVRLLKEHAPNMTLTDIKSNLDLMSESELIYITTVTERILNEFWGKNALSGIKNVAGAGMDAAKGAASSAYRGASAAGQRVKGAASNLGQRAKGAATDLAQGAKNVASGVGAAAGQVAQNVGDMYSTGKQSSNQAEVLTKARESIDQLAEYLRQAEESRLIPIARGQTMNMSLNNIIKKLETAQQTAGAQSQSARAGGFTQGAGQAFRQGMQS